MPETHRIAIALGSNLGNRRGHLAWAFARFAQHFDDLQLSSIIETDPVDVPTVQPPYLNAAATGRTALSAEATLRLLLELEAERGRTRVSFRAPRTLDLDLILYNDLVIDAPGLVVPHPGFRDRQFVLQPLAEIAAAWVDPVTGRTIADLWDAFALANNTTG